MYNQVKIFNRKVITTIGDNFGEDDLTEVNKFLKEVENLVDIKAIGNDILITYFVE